MKRTMIGLTTVGILAATPAGAMDITGPQLEEFYLVQLAVNQCPALGFPAEKTGKLAAVVDVMEKGSSFSNPQLLEMRIKARDYMDKNQAKVCSDVAESIPKIVNDLH